MTFLNGSRIVNPRRTALAAFASCGVLALGGCKTTVEVKPIKVEPIFVTIDVNIKVDQQLDHFFDFEDRPVQPSGDVQQLTPRPEPSSSQPATSPAPAQGGGS